MTANRLPSEHSTTDRRSGAIPAGNTNGSKLISVAALASSLSTWSSVRVPTSTFSRDGGQGSVASVVESTALPNDENQMPAERLTVNLGDQCVKQVILVLPNLRSAGGLEGLVGRQDPAHRRCAAGRVDKPKRIEAVERCVGESGCWRLVFDDFHSGHSFRMACQKRLHLRRIGFACCGVGLRGEQLLVEPLRCIDCKNRQIDHRRSPKFAVRR